MRQKVELERWAPFSAMRRCGFVLNWWHVPLRPHWPLNRSSEIAATASAAGHPLRLDKDRIDRGARRHEQAIALPAAETHVGAALGQHDAADHLAVRGE